MVSNQYPKKIVHFLIGCIFVLQVILNAEEQRQIDLGKFHVSDDIPTSWMLAHTPYKGNQIINERKDIPEDIAEKERMYIWPWCTKACSSELRKLLEPSDIFFVSGVGEHNDDAGVLKWSYNKRYPNDPHYDPSDCYDIELIDSRIITYLVHYDNFHNLDILDIFKTVVNYKDEALPKFTTVKLIESHILTEGESYGKISVTTKSAGWFDAPIEWYRKNDHVLFAFEKVVKLPKLKIAPRYSRENNPVGGIPVSDPRSFRRFDNPNREQLTEEYFHKYFPPEILQEYVIMGKPGEVMGKFQEK